MRYLCGEDRVVEEIRGKVETSKELKGQRNKKEEEGGVERRRGGEEERGEQRRGEERRGEEERRYICGEESVGTRYVERLKLRKSWRARGIK